MTTGSELPSWSSLRDTLSRGPLQARRDSLLINKPPVGATQLHPMSRRMVRGLTNQKGICKKWVKKIKIISIIGKRDAITPMTDPLTKGVEEETLEENARSGRIPMMKRRVHKVVTVPVGLGTKIPDLTIGTKVTHEMLTRR